MALSLVLAALLCGQVEAAEKLGMSWHWHDDGWQQLDLMKGNKQVGSYNPKTGVYRSLVDYSKNLWSPPCQAPAAIPSWCPAPPGQQSDKNFGLDRFRIPVWESIVKDGERISPAEYRAALEKVPDDKDVPWLVVIGSKEKREAVLQAWNASQGAGKEKLAVRVWSVPPDHWSLKDLATGRPAFKVEGEPTIYLQAPDGRVLHRQDDYRGPGDIEAIRTVKKNYDAKKDTDWRSWLRGLILPDINPAYVVAGGAGLLLLFGRRKG
jgi:hypothetical protein